VVTVGLAVTTEPVEALKVPAGAHVYEFAPFAVKVAEAPLQMVGEFTVTVGVGLTVTVVTAVAVQVAAEEPVIV
jgi:hypothetical protein